MPLSKLLNYVAPRLSLSLFAGSAYLSTLDHTDGGIGAHVDAILLCLSSSSLASSQLVPISIRSRLTMSIQFLLGHPGYLLYPLSSHCIAWRGILESSILNTCRNHLSLLSLMISSNFQSRVFFLISSFLTLSFHVIPNSLHWNLWWRAASSFFHLQANTINSKSHIYKVLSTVQPDHNLHHLSFISSPPVSGGVRVFATQGKRLCCRPL